MLVTKSTDCHELARMFQPSHDLRPKAVFTPCIDFELRTEEMLCRRNLEHAVCPTFFYPSEATFNNSKSTRRVGQLVPKLATAEP